MTMSNYDNLPNLAFASALGVDTDTWHTMAFDGLSMEDAIASTLGGGSYDLDFSDLNDTDPYAVEKALYQTDIINTTGENPLLTPWGPGLDEAELGIVTEEFPGINSASGVDPYAWEDYFDESEKTMYDYYDDFGGIETEIDRYAVTTGNIGSEWDHINDAGNEIETNFNVPGALFINPMNSRRVVSNVTNNVKNWVGDRIEDWSQANEQAQINQFLATNTPRAAKENVLIQQGADELRRDQRNGDDMVNTLNTGIREGWVDPKAAERFIEQIREEGTFPSGYADSLDAAFVAGKADSDVIRRGTIGGQEQGGPVRTINQALSFNPGGSTYMQGFDPYAVDDVNPWDFVPSPEEITRAEIPQGAFDFSGIEAELDPKWYMDVDAQNEREQARNKARAEAFIEQERDLQKRLEELEDPNLIGTGQPVVTDGVYSPFVTVDKPGQGFYDVTEIDGVPYIADTPWNALFIGFVKSGMSPTEARQATNERLAGAPGLGPGGNIVPTSEITGVEQQGFGAAPKETRTSDGVKPLTGPSGTLPSVSAGSITDLESYMDTFYRLYNQLPGSGGFEVQDVIPSLYANAEAMYHLQARPSDRFITPQGDPAAIFESDPVNQMKALFGESDDDALREDMEAKFPTEQRGFANYAADFINNPMKRRDDAFYKDVEQLRDSMYRFKGHRYADEDYKAAATGNLYDDDGQAIKLGKDESASDVMWHRYNFMDPTSERALSRLSNIVAGYNTLPGADLYTQEFMKSMTSDLLTKWIRAGRTTEEFLNTYVDGNRREFIPASGRASSPWLGEEIEGF